VRDYRPDLVMQALWILENNYSGEEVLSAFRLVNDLALIFNADKTEKHRLLMNLTKGLLAKDSSLPADPIDAMLMYYRKHHQGSPAILNKKNKQEKSVPEVKPKKRKATSSEFKTPVPRVKPVVKDARTSVFLGFIHYVAEQVHTNHRHSLNDVCAEFNDELNTSEIGEKTRDFMVSWCKKPGNRAYKHKMEINEAENLTHSLYISLCNTLGPVAADKVLTKAIHSANQMPEAREFSPNKLL